MLRSPGDTQKLPQAQLALTFMALGGGYVRTFAEFSLAGERLSLVIRHMGAAPHQSIFSEMSEAMDKAKSGMVVLHGAKVVYASAAARGILGHPLDELPMAAFAEIAAPSALPKALGLIKDFELTGRRQDFDLWVKRPGGAARQLSFRHIALGRIVGEDRIALMIDECCDERADEHRRLLETLLGNLPGCAYRCRNDSEWTMSFVSEGCELLTGYRPEDLLDSRRISYNHIIHPEDRQGVWDDIQQALAEDRRFDISYRIIRADGAERQVRETGCGVTGADSLRHIEGFIMDVTEREEAVAALRRGEERLRTIIQGAPDMIFIKGRDHRYLLANPAACEENGLPEDRIVGHTDAEVWGDDVARKLADEDRLVFSGQTHRGERTIPGPRGPRTLSHVKVPLKDSDGNVASICSFVRNVTDQTRVAAELRESEARYRALVEASPDAIFLCDAAGTLLEVNDAAASLYGFERTADLVGRGIFEFVADAGADSFNDFDWSAGIDRWFIRKDGSRFFGEMRFATLRDGRILGINRDVTCRLKRQFELDRLKRAMDQSAEGLLVMEPDSTVSYVNAAFCRITGLAAEEVLGRRGDLIREALGLPISPRVFEKLSRGEAVRLMTTGTRRTGETWRAEEIVNPILDDAGGIIGFFSVLVDKDFAR